MRAIVLFASSALALLIPPPIALSENLALAGSLGNDRAANSSRLGGAKCLPAIYGANVNSQSCINALGKIPRTTAQSVYGTRGSAGTGIVIPIRYQSDDGGCAITLRVRSSDASGRDVARSIDIADAASDVIDRCVVPPNRKYGGSANGFSAYLPNHRCRLYPIGDSSCAAALIPKPIERSFCHCVGSILTVNREKVSTINSQSP